MHLEYFGYKEMKFAADMDVLHSKFVCIPNAVVKSPYFHFNFLHFSLAGQK